MRIIRILTVLLLVLQSSSLMAQSDTLSITNSQWNLDYSVTKDSLTAGELAEFQSLSSDFQLQIENQMKSYQLTFDDNGAYLLAMNGVVMSGSWQLDSTRLTTTVKSLQRQFEITTLTQSEMVLTVTPHVTGSIFNKWFLNKN